MLTIKIPKNKKIDRRVLSIILRVLKNGGVVAFPSETTYGLACDPRNRKAVKKIFQMKGRDEGKPLQLIAGSLAQVVRLGMLNKGSKLLASRYWPGPLTLLMPLKKGMHLAPEVSPERSIGIRVSSSEISRQIAMAYGHPFAATSANRSGLTPAFSGRGVIKAFEGFEHQPDLLLDIGSLPRRKPSTVARVHENGTVEVLRRGGVRL